MNAFEVITLNGPRAWIIVYAPSGQMVQDFTSNKFIWGDSLLTALTFRTPDEAQLLINTIMMNKTITSGDFKIIERTLMCKIVWNQLKYIQNGQKEA